jgi:hypothetical protein
MGEVAMALLSGLILTFVGICALVMLNKDEKAAKEE